MFTIEGRETAAHLRDQAEVDSLIAALAASGYVPVLRSGAQATIRALTGRDPSLSSSAVLQLLRATYGPSRSPLRRGVTGEIFTKDGHLFALVPVDQRLHAWAVGEASSTEAIEDFTQLVATKAKSSLDGRRLRGMSWEWKQVALERMSYRGALGRRARTELAAKPVTLEDGDVELARLLQSTETRAFMRRLAQLGKARSVDALGDSPEASNAQALMEQDAIRQEFLLVCRKDSHTLCTVQDRSEIETSAFRCSICGRPFPEELVQEVYALSDRGRRMLDGSHWMTVWVTKALTDMGVPEAAITWSATAGEDELDIILELHGGQVFFELKDREFGLGDAYPFSSRVQRYGGTAGVVVATGGVAEEVKKYLEEQQRNAPQRMFTIESEEELTSRLASILDSLSQIATRRTLGLLFDQVNLAAGPVIDQWVGRPKT